MSAQGAYWYTVFFYSGVFMQTFLKVDADFTNLMILCAAVLSAPLYVFFAWLSDKVGRKPVMWLGMTIGLVALLPGLMLLSSAANPALVRASRATPVVVVADPADCGSQFSLTKVTVVTSCDIAKAALANAGVNYTSVAAAPGQTAVVKVGRVVVPSVDARGLAGPASKAAADKVTHAITAALATAGYPVKSDPAQRDVGLILAVLAIFTIAATALYGPMAAALTELFPARVRYTALSLPYHLGTGWIGGFQPVVSFSIVVATGNIYAGLWYPAIFTAISIIACLIFLPETRGRSLDA